MHSTLHSTLHNIKHNRLHRGTTPSMLELALLPGLPYVAQIAAHPAFRATFRRFGPPSSEGAKGMVVSEALELAQAVRDLQAPPSWS